MLIIDAHLDLAWNALQGTVDLLFGPYDPGSGGMQAGPPGTVALPEMRQGEWLYACHLAGPPDRHRSPDIDWFPAQALGLPSQLAYYHALNRQVISSPSPTQPALNQLPGNGKPGMLPRSTTPNLQLAIHTLSRLLASSSA
jgi:hypothetical protein